MSVTTTYLQMFAPNGRTATPPRDDLLVLYAQRPTLPYFWFLYDTVGRDWDWTSRRKLSEAELIATIHDPMVEFHVLFAAGVPAGFVELDRRIPREIEIKQFGLVPEFIGQGLGRYFLQWVIDYAWKHRPGRLWLHTCTNDHPGALPNYLKAGFEVYRVDD
ncbi:MAG TPA: GNAT family N-acetyltransferase [Planctomycetaceae bacterium]|nr:GNAT family N-acetyltransferase [Planctomycetaceae bacterium]